MRDFHLTPFRGEGFCSRCSNLCKQFCHKCEDAPSYDGTHQITYYCSVKCQLLDWPSHHSDCRARQARKKLHRAVAILQPLWYKIRSEAFDWELLRMDAWDEELELIAHDREVIVDEEGKREKFVYQKFPACEYGWVESQLNAALVFGSCQFAVRMLHGPLRKMIDGMPPLSLYNSRIFTLSTSKLLTRLQDSTTTPRRFLLRRRDAGSMSHACGKIRPSNPKIH